MIWRIQTWQLQDYFKICKCETPAQGIRVGRYMCIPSGKGASKLCSLTVSIFHPGYKLALLKCWGYKMKYAVLGSSHPRRKPYSYHKEVLHVHGKLLQVTLLTAVTGKCQYEEPLHGMLRNNKWHQKLRFWKRLVPWFSPKSCTYKFIHCCSCLLFQSAWILSRKNLIF